jgi:hypothetical protein
MQNVTRAKMKKQCTFSQSSELIATFNVSGVSEFLTLGLM